MNKVSVIIPTYNVGECLKRCLNSILKQDFTNLEIIVVDDCSTDNTRQILETFKDKKIKKYFLKKNGGVSAARNYGLDHATGDYILFVDSDDILLPNAISKLVDAALEYDSDYVDSFNLFICEENGKQKMFTETKLPAENLVLGSLKDDIRILDMNTYIKGKLISKKLLGNLRFDESLRRYEDMVLEHELKLRIKNYVMLNTVVYAYIQRDDSLDNTLGLKHMAYLDAAIKIKNIYKNSSKEIRDKIESLLVQNMYFIAMGKIVKNDLDNNENAKIVYNYLMKIKEVFPNYLENKYLSGFVKYQINHMTLKSLKRDIKLTKKLNFIKYHFDYLEYKNKYYIDIEL